MAASIPLRSDFDRLHREARDAKNTARASRLLARETIDDGASFWTSNGLGRSEAPKEQETGWSGSSRDTWRRTASLNWKAK